MFSFNRPAGAVFAAALFFTPVLAVAQSAAETETPLPQSAPPADERPYIERLAERDPTRPVGPIERMFRDALRVDEAEAPRAPSEVGPIERMFSEMLNG